MSGNLSVKDVEDVIRGLGVEPPSREMLGKVAVIAPHVRDLVIRARDGHEESKGRVRDIFTCISSGVRDALAQIGVMDPSLSRLVEIGNSNWAEFRKALRTAVQSGDQAAAEQVRGMFSPAEAPQSMPAPSSRGYSAPAPSAPQGSERSPSADGEREYESVHVYGGKAALCFSADQTKQNVHTIRIEGAAATSPRQYNWKDKISVQLTSQELPMVLATLMGWLPKVEYSSHGVANDKGFSIERQQGKLYIRMFQKDMGQRATPVFAPDVYPVTSLLIKQMMKNHPHMSSDCVLALAKQVADISIATGAAPQAAPPAAGGASEQSDWGTGSTGSPAPSGGGRPARQQPEPAAAGKPQSGDNWL